MLGHNVQDEPATSMPTNLKLLSCLDAPELGELRRQELGIPHSTAAGLGWKAIQAIEEGYYLTSKSQRVDLQAHLAHALANKRSIAPDDPLPTVRRGVYPETRVQVSNETTLGASQRHETRHLCEREYGDGCILVLTIDRVVT